MISGSTRPLLKPALLLGLLLNAGPSLADPTTAAPAEPKPAGSEQDAALDALFAALARPTPNSTGFVEQRQSALLEQPLLLRGELQRPAADTLVRAVESPYRERATIRDQRVTVEREGSRSRSFSLRRAPELAALLAGFRAMLDGDRSALAPFYRIELQQQGERWTIQLIPKTSRQRQQIAGLDLHGHADQLDCVAIRQTDAADSLLLVGPAAAAERPDFAGLCQPG